MVYTSSIRDSPVDVVRYLPPSVECALLGVSELNQPCLPTMRYAQQNEASETLARVRELYSE
jgi:hypothetical protein